jgi:hypothetical protein
MRNLHPSPPPVHRLALLPGDLARTDPPLYGEIFGPEECVGAMLASVLRRVAFTRDELAAMMGDDL